MTSGHYLPFDCLLNRTAIWYLLPPSCHIVRHILPPSGAVKAPPAAAATLTPIDPQSTPVLMPRIYSSSPRARVRMCTNHMHACQPDAL